MRQSNCLLPFLLIAHCEAFVSPTSNSLAFDNAALTTKTTTTTLNAHNTRQSLGNAVASSILATSLVIATATSPVQAYSDSDYASETVQDIVTSLQKVQGNADETFKVYEEIAEIISEGKGIGGMVNYEGIQLERGYIADEDTSIYNPGLTLLTESEKERLVEAVVDSRKAGFANGQWNENNESAFEELRGKLDPLHMTELKGFLGFVPFYGAIIYLAVLAVQQFVRGLFPIAYGIGVLAFFGPILALVAAGPQ